MRVSRISSIVTEVLTVEAIGAADAVRVQTFGSVAVGGEAVGEEAAGVWNGGTGQLESRYCRSRGMVVGVMAFWRFVWLFW
jgi:hypothetical protein